MSWTAGALFLAFVTVTRLVYFRVENVSSDSLIWVKGEKELESSGGLLYIRKLARDQVITLK